MVLCSPIFTRPMLDGVIKLPGCLSHRFYRLNASQAFIFSYLLDGSIIFLSDRSNQGLIINTRKLIDLKMKFSNQPHSFTASFNQPRLKQLATGLIDMGAYQQQSQQTSQNQAPQCQGLVKNLAQKTQNHNSLLETLQKAGI